ncbi:hypothetical protein FB45DRAFT_882731 [Roridomyces roridus]|uniref:Uncharacterized protein n=1 Tax=Roridomyces roridus TaxID=1738132 RepID=A0AAD7F5M9_9AGAR|nr:hypothetical protein FB45DRAFT_882731 [Roridomyces roridus]
MQHMDRDSAQAKVDLVGTCSRVRSWKWEARSHSEKFYANERLQAIMALESLEGKSYSNTEIVLQEISEERQRVIDTEQTRHEQERKEWKKAKEAKERTRDEVQKAAEQQVSRKHGILKYFEVRRKNQRASTSSTQPASSASSPLVPAAPSPSKSRETLHQTSRSAFETTGQASPPPLKPHTKTEHKFHRDITFVCAYAYFYFIEEEPENKQWMWYLARDIFNKYPKPVGNHSSPGDDYPCQNRISMQCCSDKCQLIFPG